MPSVMSFNINHGTNRLGEDTLFKQAEFIRNNKPDFILLQEIDRNVPRSGNVDQATYFSKRLGLQMMFAKVMDLDGGEHGIAIGTSGKIQGACVIPIPVADDKEKRIILHCQILLHGKTYNVFNTQFPTDEAERITAMNMLTEYIEANEFINVIFGGDLNIGVSKSENNQLSLKPLDESPEIEILKGNFYCMNFSYTSFEYMGQRHLLDTICSSKGFLISEQRICDTILSNHSIPIISISRCN